MARKSKIDERLSRLLRRISGNVRKLRQKREWTQETAATKGDFDFRFYQRIESGKYSINLATLINLAQLFHVDVRVFFE